MFRFVRLLRIPNKQWLIMINCMCVNAFWCVLILVTWFRVCEVHQLCFLRKHYFLALRTPPLPNKRPRLPLPDVPPAFSDVAMLLSEIASLWIFAPLAQKETKETKSTEMTLCICLKRQHGTSFRYFCFFTSLSFPATFTTFWRQLSASPETSRSTKKSCLSKSWGKLLHCSVWRIDDLARKTRWLKGSGCGCDITWKYLPDATCARSCSTIRSCCTTGKQQFVSVPFVAIAGQTSRFFTQVSLR